MLALSEAEGPATTLCFVRVLDAGANRTEAECSRGECAGGQFDDQCLRAEKRWVRGRLDAPGVNPASLTR